MEQYPGEGWESDSFSAILLNMGVSRGRGFALISVSLLTVILMLMVIALYLTARGGLFSSLNHERHTAALYVAEAGLADSIEALEAASFVDPGNLSGVLSSGGRWDVVFKSGPPFSQFDSVNNLTGSGSAESYRGANTVPPYSALIVVRARLGGVERVVEGIITRGGGGGDYEYAMLASGTIRMQGDVLVDGVTGLDDPTAVPGKIHTNATSSTPVEWLGGGNINISGSVSAQGGVVDLQGYVPGGGISPAGTLASFPSVDVPSEIAAKTSSPAPTITPFGTTTLTSGDYYHSGDLTVDGDIDLQGGNLYVDGQLNVNGSIKGEGAVYVAGDTSFKGDAAVLGDSANNVSLYSQGNISLSGFDGDAYLESLAAADAPANKYWNDAKLTVAEMQTLLGNPSYVPTDFLTGSQNGPLDVLRRTLGQTMPGAVVPGRQLNTLGELSGRIAAQPPGPSRDFLVKKVESLRRFFQPGDELPGGDAQAYTNWAGGLYDVGGTLDFMLDNGTTPQAASVFPAMVTYVNAIDYDHLGSAYFRGRLYTNGYLYASDDITVLGSITVDGTPGPGTTLPNGVTAYPGDVVLDDDSRITYVEDFHSGLATLPGSTLSVETWIGR